MPGWLIMILMVVTVAFAADTGKPIAPLPPPVESTGARTTDNPGMENPTDQEIAEMMNLLEMMELLDDVDLLKDFDVLMEED